MTNKSRIFVIFTEMLTPARDKRVVLVYWKHAKDQFEVFSNLKNFCLSYPQYNYNTLSNYLSKEKIAYENDQVRVERKQIIARPKQNGISQKVAPVLRRVRLHEALDNEHDLDYWLSQAPAKRIEAVTFLISQSLKKGSRMDRKHVKRVKRNK